MLGCQILRFSALQDLKLFTPLVLQYTHKHAATCPVNKAKQKRCPGAGGLKKSGPSKTTGIPLKRGPVCKLPEDRTGGGSGSESGNVLRRAKMPGKVRMGFIPEEWFLFLKPMTGVSGPYILMIGLSNYLVSKEIFVMEHEYYMGISLFIMVYYGVTKFGPPLAAYLDKEVDSFTNDLEKTRQDELDFHKTIIKNSETAIWRANGQKDLMLAKKENIAIQLEAIYRERGMIIYQRVKSRLDYHVKRQRIEKRIQQKWMAQWILTNVEKSFTPEFKKRAMQYALSQLSNLVNQLPQK
ncbi:hypothetical protein HW555_003759 [Spodoptera exigua]|uniref:ATP synthase subunit b n=1 Tax=Spodoptera exigua TaxID=7107 RepID=A0A835GMP7_SPOEX|nr:hypothetical protein HW555_003759 [Spodoptera exigua]